jgi:hypothetical protein
MGVPPAAEDFRQEGPATGYTLVLPPGWRQIPVRSGTRSVIRKITHEAFRDLPTRISRDNVTPYRIELERRLTAAAASARQQGGTELYLPVEMVDGMVIPASFVVSEGSFHAAPGEPGSGSPEVLYRLTAGNDDAQAVTLDEATGVRVEHTAPPDPAHGIDYGSRRVDYTIAVPGDASRWLIFAFSALGAGDQGDTFAGLLVELFDAIMSTFRWTRSSAALAAGSENGK